MLTLTQSPEVVAHLDKVATLIGQTPLLPLRRVGRQAGVPVLAKLEWRQLGQSVKARPAFEIIKAAVLNGQLGQGQRLLDATTGNIGICYAAICARMGLPLTLCLPEDSPSAHLRTLRSYGAELQLTPAEAGIEGARAEAAQLALMQPNQYFFADQYQNEQNWKAHYHGTAREIYHQTRGQVTHFVAGLGSSGTITGTAMKLKEVNADMRAIALQPAAQAHTLPGWHVFESDDVPGIFRPDLIDETLTISEAETSHWLERVAREEGMLISRSAAANLAGAIRVAERLDQGMVVTVFADDASRYLR
jgi:S-sulfo-L-cysteine synthase (O-acetyl-L-serine-dependent)